MYRFDVKILNQSRDFLLATVLISRDLISEIPCPLLDSAAPWEVHSCSWPYVRYPSVWETDGKTRENSRNFPHSGQKLQTPALLDGARWYSLRPRGKYLIKSSSAKISRRIFSEGSLDSSCKESPLKRDRHYYLEWALIQTKPWTSSYSTLIFQPKLPSQQQFLRPDFLQCDIEQLFSQVFWGLLCDRLIELLWKPFRNSSEAAAGLSKYQTFNFALIWNQEKSYSMSPSFIIKYYLWKQNIFVGENSIFCGSDNSVF